MVRLPARQRIFSDAASFSEPFVERITPASPSLGLSRGILRSEGVSEAWWGSWVSQRARELLSLCEHRHTLMVDDSVG